MTSPQRIKIKGLTDDHQAQKDINRYYLKERLAELEHNQWEHWSKALANRMDNWVNQDWSRLTFEDNVKKQIENWQKNWKPYKELPDNIKDYDREWANMVLEEFDIAIEAQKREDERVIGKLVEWYQENYLEEEITPFALATKWKELDGVGRR